MPFLGGVVVDFGGFAGEGNGAGLSLFIFKLSSFIISYFYFLHITVVWQFEVTLFLTNCYLG